MHFRQRKFLLLATSALISSNIQQAVAYGGEDYANGRPWHHLDISLRALAGDTIAYPQGPVDGDVNSLVFPEGVEFVSGSGFSRGAAMSIAWHADYIDSYLYNPIFWIQGIDGDGGFNRRVKAALSMYDDLARLHFDDTFTARGLNDNFERYAAGTLIGLKWAADNNDLAAAHQIIGVSLHAIQDFYSHSNWVDDPERRNRTWFELSPSERVNLNLYAGAFETNAAQSPMHHGAVSLSCSILGRPGVGDVLGPVCTGKFSPFQNMNFCSSFKACKGDDVATVDMAATLPLFGTLESESLLYLAPAGMAIDTTLVTRVGGDIRGLTTGKEEDYQFTGSAYNRVDMSPAQCLATVNFGVECDHKTITTDEDGNPVRDEKCTRVKPLSDYQCALDTDYLFAGSKKLAIRASEQWLAFIEAAMNDMGEEYFWKAVKRDSVALEEREKQFEDFAQLAFQFISTGPYPVGNAGGIQSSDGYYLRLRIKTADVRHAGSNADILVLVEGDGFQQEILLDYLPTNDPDGRATNPLFVYNDFEQGDHDVYTVGPFPALPQRLTIINDAPNAGDVFVAFWRGVGESIAGSFEKIGKGVRALVGGGIDYVNDDHRYYTLQEIRTLQGFYPSGQFTDELRIKEKNQGDFAVRYRFTDKFATGITEEQKDAGWARFSLQFTRLFAYKESEIDGLSNSDELLVFASATPFNGDENAVPLLYRSEILDDVDEGEEHFLKWADMPSSQDIILPRFGAVAINGQIFESDIEKAGERNDLWNEFSKVGNERHLTENKDFKTTLGEAIAEDLRISTIEVTPFKRSIRPTIGKTITYTIRDEIKGGQAYPFELDDHEMTPLIPADAPDISTWQASPPLLSSAASGEAPMSPSTSTPTPGNAVSIRPEFSDSIEHLKLDALSPAARAKFQNVVNAPFAKFLGPLNGVFTSSLGDLSLIHLGDRVTGTLENYGELEGAWDAATGTLTGQITFETIQNGTRRADIAFTAVEGSNSYRGTAQLEGLDHVQNVSVRKVQTRKHRPVKAAQYDRLIGRTVEVEKLNRTGRPRISKDLPAPIAEE